MNRILSIDFLRGFVVLLMTIDHTRYIFSSVKINAPIGVDMPASYYFIRWVTHLCAPTFAFLAGLSIALRPLQNSKLEFDSSVQITIAKRGLFVMALTFFISIIRTIMFNNSVYTVYFTELWAIGAGMIFVALLMRCHPLIIAAVSFGLVAGHHLLEVFDHVDSVLWSFLHVRNTYPLIENYVNLRISYPLLPWLGIVGLGYVMGYYFFRPNAQFENQRKQLLLSLGLGSLFVFSLLRYTNWYGDPNPFVASTTSFMQNVYSFLDVTKYPPSLLFFLVTISFSFFVLAFSDSKFFRQPNRFVTLICEYGQAALFYFLLHLVLVLFYAFTLRHLFFNGESPASDHLGVTLIMAAVIVVTAYPLIQVFNRYRHANKARYPILAYF